MAVATSFGVSARSHKLVRHDGRLAAKHACKDHWQWDVGDVPHHSATASMVPAFVTLDGVQIGHPVVDGVSDQDACDQIAAIGVADGIVRGVSHHISKGFSLGIVGTGGEMIEFRYYSAARKKVFYSDFRLKMEDNKQIGSFRKPFELVLRETPLCADTCAKCSHFLVAGKFTVPAAPGACVENKGTCQYPSALPGPCVAGSKVTSGPCYTPCPAGSHPSSAPA